MQDLNLACDDCVFIPRNRQNRVRDNDFDELHYQCGALLVMMPALPVDPRSLLLVVDAFRRSYPGKYMFFLTH